MDGRAYRDLAEATALIGTFLEEVYNRHRLHSVLAYLAAEIYEANRPTLLGLPHVATPAAKETQ